MFEGVSSDKFCINQKITWLIKNLMTRHFIVTEAALFASSWGKLIDYYAKILVRCVRFIYSTGVNQCIYLEEQVETTWEWLCCCCRCCGYTRFAHFEMLRNEICTIILCQFVVSQQCTEEDGDLYNLAKIRAVLSSIFFDKLTTKNMIKGV